MTTTKKAPAVVSAANAVVDGWLNISTEGFAQQNAGREPAHLVKELVQNAMDAIDGRPGRVHLTFTMTGSGLTVFCKDDGAGVSDMNNINTMFWTSKQDSPLNRGRMGRGFKEMLCLAIRATVSSQGKCKVFAQKDGNRVTKTSLCTVTTGTEVQMVMPWQNKVVPDLVKYFGLFLPANNVTLIINDKKIKHRQPTHVVDATLTTETFQDSKWVKSPRDTQIELIPVAADEEPMIYEMGIPVCPADWDRPYHINVLQRVPMNPNRDAVMSGYPQKLHRVCLPVLLDEMEPDEIQKDWVGEAAAHLEPDIQKQVISRAFGDNVVRSVPTMGGGRRDFDADAKEMGRDIVRTAHLSGGFRKIVADHVPSSAEVVVDREMQIARKAAAEGFVPADLAKDRDTQRRKERQRLLDKCGGAEFVEQVLAFGVWFCSRLLQGDEDAVVSGKVGILDPETSMSGLKGWMSWSSDNVLTLALDVRWIWAAPLGPETLGTFVHEAAHHRAMHHGDEFHKEVQRLTGVAAYLMLKHAEHIRATWPALVKSSNV